MSSSQGASGGATGGATGSVSPSTFRRCRRFRTPRFAPPTPHSVHGLASPSLSSGPVALLSTDTPTVRVGWQLWMLPQVIPSVHILDQPRPAQGGGGGEDRDEAREDREAGAGERGVERAANIQLEDRGSLAGSDPQRVHAGGSGGESRQGAAGGHPAEPDKADGGGHGEAGGVRNAGGGGWGALLEGLPLASAGSGSVRREGDGEGGGGGGHAEEVGPPAGASGAGGAANEDEGDASARRGRAQDETLPPDEAARRGSGGVGSAGSGRKKRTSVVGGGAGKLVVEAVEEDYDFDDVEGRDECIICFEVRAATRPRGHCQHPTPARLVFAPRVLAGSLQTSAPPPVRRRDMPLSREDASSPVAADGCSLSL